MPRTPVLITKPSICCLTTWYSSGRGMGPMTRSREDLVRTCGKWFTSLSPGLCQDKMMKKLLNKAFWFFVTLAGLYLVFIEVGMAISESHALRGTNILYFAFFLALGVFLFLLGLSKLRRKLRRQGMETLLLGNAPFCG